MRVFIPRFLGAISYLGVLTVVGTVGYVAIEGWQWREGLYMTVITVTAVGFREVHPLSELGRDFTMGLLAAGITGVGVWFALITSFIVEFDLGHVRRKRWRARMLEQLDGHIVLCGAGRTGRQVMEEGAEGGLLVAVGYAPLRKIVGRQLNLHAISLEHPNVVLPHLTGEIRQDLMAVL